MVVHQPRDRGAVVHREMRRCIDAHRRHLSPRLHPAPRPRRARAHHRARTIAAIAELARHFDDAALGERRLDFVPAGYAQRVRDARDRALAAERHRTRVEDPQIVVRKQRPQDLREIRPFQRTAHTRIGFDADARPRRIAVRIVAGQPLQQQSAHAAVVRRSHSRLCSCSDVAR